MATFTLIVSKDYTIPHVISTLDNIRVMRLPINSDNRIMRRVFFTFLPLLSFATQKFDVIDDLSQPPTLLRTRKRFVTIHDIRRLDFNSGAISRYAYALSLIVCRIFGCTVVTVSKTMAEKLSRYYSAEQIRVIENSVPTSIVKYFEKATLVCDSEMHEPESYILSVGHFEERKNYKRLIQAFKALAGKTEKLHLLIVGQDNGSQESVHTLIREIGLESRVKLLTNVPDAKLFSLYKSAQAFVFPSLYEGFGIPLLEAMAASCPMAVSETEIFREIAGDAALYFDPFDIDAIHTTTADLLESGSLRKDLAAKGKDRLKEYDADRLAGRLAALYTSGTTIFAPEISCVQK